MCKFFLNYLKKNNLSLLILKFAAAFEIKGDLYIIRRGDRERGIKEYSLIHLKKSLTKKR